MKVVEAPSPEAGREPGPSAAEPAPAPRHLVHRLRDLDRRGRWWAVAFALALLLMPVISFAHYAPDWTPAADPALMALRALDVGTSRTPVVGQPSTSGMYVTEVTNVSHPGPIHFYLLALPVRLLGAAYGMLLVSLLITAGCVLLSAWAIFRQLGPPGGVLGAVILGVITFTTGASSLMHPVSSNIAGYPLLCSMVLLWCLLCDDLRLLPVTAVVVSFAAQQHLSAVPSLLAALGLVGAVLVARQWRIGRGDPEARRRLLRWAAWSGGLALVLWSPVLLQQLFGDTGNLTALVDFTRHDQRASLGFSSATRQVAHVLGIPPMLGQLNPSGYMLLGSVTGARWLTAVVVLAAAVVVAVRSRDASRPRAALGIMAVVLVVAGLFSGASVPVGLEIGRLAFYHWAWPLSLVVALGLGLAVLAWWQRTRWAQRPWATPVMLSVALVAIALPAAVNPMLERRSNTLTAAASPVERRELDELVDQIMEHRDELGRTVVLERGQLGFEGFGGAVSLELIQRGVDVRMSARYSILRAVHEGRIVDRSTVDSGLVVVIGDGLTPYPREVPGELVAEIVTTEFDRDAYFYLVDRLESADQVVLGDDLERAVDDLPQAYEVLIQQAFDDLPGNAHELAKDANILPLLRDHPPQQPHLDPRMIDRVLSSLDQQRSGFQLDVYLLDREQVLDYATRSEIGAD